MSKGQLTRRGLILSGAAALTSCTTEDQQALLDAVLTQTGGSGSAGFGLTEAEAAAGIRAALNNGIGSAIAQVGRNGGFLDDVKIRIPLPGFLRETQEALSRIGLSGTLDNLQTQLNRGAEAAAPVAKDIFYDAVSQLTIRDAIGIVRGPSNAATQYLQEKTTPRLLVLFRPIMVSALNKAGAIQTFDRMVGSMRNIPLAPQFGADAKGQLIDHGVEKGLDGVFYYIGREEAAIRRDPVKRTSEILRKVFG